MSVQQGFTIKHDNPITLVDSDNNVVHTWDYFNGSTIPLGPSYNLNVYPNLDILEDTSTGFTLYDSMGDIIWQLNLQHPSGPTWWEEHGYDDLYRHHDSWVMEDTDGSPLILIGGSHIIPMDEAVNNYGRYTNWTQTPYGTYEDGSEYIDLGFIQIIKPTGIGTDNHDAELVFEWYMIDHLVQNFNSDLPNYGDINDPTKININLPGSTYVGAMGGVFNGSDFMHHNTIHYDPVRNNVIISSRNIGEGEFYVVSVATGEIVYRCCNPQNYGRGEVEDRYTNGSHGPNVIPDGYPNAGDIIWYNNEGPVDQDCGIFEDDCISEVIKVTPDYEVFPLGDFDNNQNIQIVDYDFLHTITGGGAFGLPNGNIFVTPGSGYSSLEIQDPWTSPEIVQEIPNENQEYRMVKYVCDSEQTDNYMYRVDIPDCGFDYQLGDVNQDGLLNVLDVVQLVNYILGIIEFDELSQSAADVTQDGEVNVLDIVTLVQQILSRNDISSRDRQELQRQLDRLGDDSGTTPTQQQTFTLPDGSEIILPELPSEQSRITLSYPEAGFEYQSDLSSAASLMIVGTIFVDGEESTNPGDCRIAWYISDNHSNSCGHAWCYGTCDNGGGGDYLINPNYPLNCVLPAIQGNGGCNYFPNHSQTSAYSPSGNADAIAIMWNGHVQGWDYVNNIIQSTNEGPGWSRNQLTGIAIGMSGVSAQNDFDPRRYISSGEMIDDLILYRASTGTHHRLTDESYDRIFSNVIPYYVAEFVYMGFDNAFIQTLAPDNPASPLGNEVSREIIQVPGPCNDWNHSTYGLISPSGELCDGVCGTGYSEGTNHFYSLASNYCNEGANPGSQDDYAECECVEWEISGGGYIADNSYDDYSLGTNEIHFGPPITDTPDILPGDTNVDGTLNVLDVVVLVNSILAGANNDTLMNSFPQADMDGDGLINVLDIVQMIQLILNNPTTSSRDRQELQRQLDRLGDDSGTTPTQQQTFTSPGSRETRIVGGEEVNPPGKYPFMVSVQNQGANHFCGGILVGDKWVLTAAHCVDDKSIYEVRVELGLHNQSGTDGYVYWPSNIILHPDMDMDASPNRYDFALIQLPEPVVNFEPIPLISNSEYDNNGTIATVAGWGRDVYVNTGGSDELREVDLIVDDSSCQNFHEDHLCAEPIDEDPAGHCMGDSGGPFFVNLGTEEIPSYELIGVVSYTFGGCEYGSVYGRVDGIQNWINDTIANPPDTPTEDFYNTCDQLRVSDPVLNIPIGNGPQFCYTGEDILQNMFNGNTEFNLRDVYSSVLGLESGPDEWHGPKVLVIDMSTSWCGPCYDTIPEKEAVFNQFKDHPDFMMIDILMDIGQPYSCTQWGDAGEQGVIPIIDGGSYPDSIYFQSFYNGIVSVPRFVIFDKEARFVKEGGSFGDDDVELIQNLLDGEVVCGEGGSEYDIIWEDACCRYVEYGPMYQVDDALSWCHNVYYPQTNEYYDFCNENRPSCFNDVPAGYPVGGGYNQLAPQKVICNSGDEYLLFYFWINEFIDISLCPECLDPYDLTTQEMYPDMQLTEYGPGDTVTNVKVYPYGRPPNTYWTSPSDLCNCGVECQYSPTDCFTDDNTISNQPDNPQGLPGVCVGHPSEQYAGIPTPAYCDGVTRYCNTINDCPGLERQLDRLGDRNRPTQRNKNFRRR